MKLLWTRAVLLLSFGTYLIVSACDCNDPDVDRVARVVFGDARGEIYKAQLAVAYTVVNRVNHTAYPDSVSKVLDETIGDGHHEYKTLDDENQDKLWALATSMKSTEYQSAINAAKEAICGCVTDPTGCATHYCKGVNCNAVPINPFWLPSHVMVIGHHTFACITPLFG